MEIIRNGITYTLTEEELEKAYREQEHNYLLQDAERQFDEYHCQTFCDEEHFAECFGFSGDDVCDKSSPHYLLEKFLDAYKERQDCNTAENEDWQAAIQEVLIANALNVKVSYSGVYELWNLNVPEHIEKKRITTLYSQQYDTLDELYAAAPAYIAKAFERSGICNGKVLVRMSIKKRKDIGSGDSYLHDWDFVKLGWDRYGSMVDGKLIFADNGAICQNI